MEFKLNPSSSFNLEKLYSILKDVQTAAPSRKWRFKAQLLDKYGTAILEAMGTVSARGGYPKVDFEGGAAFIEGEEWKALSPWTVAAKSGMLPSEGGKTGYASQERAQELFDQYADKIKIWAFTGRTKQTFTTSLRSLYDGGSFVGIKEGGSEYAATVELGSEETGRDATGSWYFKPIPKRPLFGVVNETFRLYLKSKLSRPDSPLALQIKEEFYQLCTEKGWGR